jgi:hypothetical protein
MGPLCRGTAVAGQIPETRVAGGDRRGCERQVGMKPHLIVALGGEVVDRGGSSVWHRAGGGSGWWRRSGEGEGAGTGRAASVLGGEGDRTVGSGNVVAERRVHTRVVAHRSWGWGGELRSLGWGFYRREREGWRHGHELLGEVRQRGPNPRAQLPRCHRRGSPWRQQRLRQKNAAAWRVPEGESGILWASRGSPRCWRAHMAWQARLPRGAPASWPAGDGTG